jgi:glucokinase
MQILRECMRDGIMLRNKGMRTPRMVLAGDIGGTNTRLALFRVTPPHFKFFEGKNYLSKDYQSLEDLLKDFLRAGIKIEAACFGVAGPVIDGKVTGTNLPWHLDARILQNNFSFGKLTLINDLVANAYGIALLNKKDFAVLNPGEPKSGNAVLISAGTGLGEGILFWNGKRHVPSPSEGGHADFAPRNELEIKLFRDLCKRFGHVSYERVLSGAGLANIYRFLRGTGKFGKEPKWLSQKMNQEDPAAVISEMAESGKSRLCGLALDIFVAIYGAAAGNLALQGMAVGGVYVGGGIAPKIIWKLRDGTFMQAFRDKGRLRGVMSQIPVRVIMNDKAALMGTACHAMDLLEEE